MKNLSIRKSDAWWSGFGLGMFGPWGGLCL